MIAAVEWNAVTLAGAFILGAVFATVGTIRVMRAILGIAQREMRPRRPPEDSTEE